MAEAATRIVSWNCATGFRAKRDALLALQPDLLVVPECSRVDAESEIGTSAAVAGTWLGATDRKGLAVFAYGSSAATFLTPIDPSIHYVVPVEIHGQRRINLLGVWTHAGPYRTHRLETCGYVGQLHRALDIYETFLIAGSRPAMWCTSGAELSPAA